MLRGTKKNQERTRKTKEKQRTSRKNNTSNSIPCVDLNINELSVSGEDLTSQPVSAKGILHLNNSITAKRVVGCREGVGMLKGMGFLRFLVSRFLGFKVSKFPGFNKSLMPFRRYLFHITEFPFHF